MSVFSDRLRERREAKGVLQVDVARIIGSSRQAYNTYETGTRKPDIDTVKALAEYFEVSADYLLGLVDAPNETLQLDALAASSDVPINELSDDGKDELVDFAKYLLAKERDRKR